MTPHEELTKASDMLVARAGEATPGPWVVWEGSERSLVCRTVDQCTCGGGFEGYGHEPGCGLEEPPGVQATREDANYIAALNPLIGASVANWLSWEAKQKVVSPPALALARQINGGAA